MNGETLSAHACCTPPFLVHSISQKTWNGPVANTTGQLMDPPSSICINHSRRHSSAIGIGSPKRISLTAIYCSAFPLSPHHALRRGWLIRKLHSFNHNNGQRRLFVLQVNYKCMLHWFFIRFTNFKARRHPATAVFQKRTASAFTLAETGEWRDNITCSFRDGITVCLRDESIPFRLTQFPD